jgi:hypothetical protein
MKLDLRKGEEPIVRFHQGILLHLLVDRRAAGGCGTILQPGPSDDMAPRVQLQPLVLPQLVHT